MGTGGVLQARSQWVRKNAVEVRLRLQRLGTSGSLLIDLWPEARKDPVAENLLQEKSVCEETKSVRGA